MSNEKAQDEKKPVGTNSKAIPVLSTTAGAVAGGVVTSAPAISAGGAAGGLTGYSIGLGQLLAHFGCGSLATVSTCFVVGGPVLGGLVGYSAYRAVKSMRRQNGKNGNNSNNDNSEKEH